MNKYYQQCYRDELYQEVIPFWEQYSIDEEGGYFTCLLPNGEVYDTDKFVWLQARQVWTFANLAVQTSDQVSKARWCRIAEHGAHFLRENGRDKHGNWYFSLTRTGVPLVAAYNIFSDCFACMAYAKLYALTGKKAYAEIALDTWKNINARQDNPKGKYEKEIPGTRPLRGFSLPMILSNLVMELGDLVDQKEKEAIWDKCIQVIMNDFYDEESGLVLENIGSEGEIVDSFAGRLLNPGHAIEAMWFMMDVGQEKGDQVLIKNAIDRMLFMLAYGWDKTYGGIFYFLDRKGYPLRQLEWDQKLWWVHLETLVGLAKGYRYTQDERCAEWFEKVHEYSWSHFRDVDHGGEWYGYLKRNGNRLNDSKGGRWKGCFHVPRALHILGSE